MPASSPFQVLSLIPPMTQLNTPYPSTAYLTGFLRSRGIEARQADLALALVLRLLSPWGLARLRDGLGQLSQREREVFDLMVNGWQNRQIAARLGIRADTVKKHRAVICEKFLVEDTAGLIELSRRDGDDANLPGLRRPLPNPGG